MQLLDWKICSTKQQVIRGIIVISKQIRFLLGAACVAAACSGSASAATTVTLTGSNTDIRTYSDGAVYAPLYDSTQTLAGIPFAFAAISGQTAITGGPVTIVTSIANPGTVYTLVNTAFGSLGSNAGNITFNATGGLSYTVNYIEGDNVRDHFYDGFINTTSSSTVTQTVWGTNTPGTAHLDMQTIVLPSAFHGQTLTSIVFDSSGKDSSTGIAFLAGVTVAAPVPEPPGYAMLGLGLGLLGAVVRRRSRA